MAYNAKLEALQAGEYDSILIDGQASDWTDVLAVFSAKTAGTSQGMDVATLDADPLEKLSTVFWDMTAITSYVETIAHDDWREYILDITISPKTTEEMRTVYAFTNYQNTALDELLKSRSVLAALAGSLTITNTHVLKLLNTSQGYGGWQFFNGNLSPIR